MSIFLPQVEPYLSEMCFLPKSLLELGRNAWSKNIDAIFGGTADEGLMAYFTSPKQEQFEFIDQDNSLLLLPETRKVLNVKEAKRRGQLLKELYFKDPSDKLAGYIEVIYDFNYFLNKIEHIFNHIVFY